MGEGLIFSSALPMVDRARWVTPWYYHSLPIK